MTRTRAISACGAVVGAVLALTLAGCGSTDDGAAEDDSPLDGYLNEIYGEYDPDAPDPLGVRAEELIAACMADEGFEYFPLATQAGYVLAPVDGMGSLEFAKEFGYGYTTEPWGEGGGNLTWPVTPDQSEAQLQNEEYRDSLSREARQEYDAALVGVMAAPPDDLGFDLDPTEDAEQFGCSGRAYAQVFEADSVGQQFSDVQDAINQMWTAVDEDPRVGEAITAWGSCMATTGYPGLVQFIDAENLVIDIVNRFTNATSSQVDLSLGETEFDAIKASVPDELSAVQAEEIAVAVADATCRQETDYERIHHEVQWEIEQHLVDTYREDLEAWVDAVQAAEDATR